MCAGLRCISVPVSRIASRVVACHRCGMRKPKTGRTADLPAEHPPASLIWTVGRLIILARYLFAFIEVSFGSKVAQRVWREAARRPRQRAIKVLSDADMGGSCCAA
jgi:hypothetical protein